MVRPKFQQTQMNKATRRAAVSPLWTVIKCKAVKARQKPNIPTTPLANTDAVVCRPALAYKTADMLSQTIGMTATNPAISGPFVHPNLSGYFFSNFSKVFGNFLPFIARSLKFCFFQIFVFPVM